MFCGPKPKIGTLGGQLKPQPTQNSWSHCFFQILHKIEWLLPVPPTNSSIQKENITTTSWAKVMS